MSLTNIFQDISCLRSLVSKILLTFKILQTFDKHAGWRLKALYDIVFFFFVLLHLFSQILNLSLLRFDNFLHFSYANAPWSLLCCRWCGVYLFCCFFKVVIFVAKVIPMIITILVVFLARSILFIIGHFKFKVIEGANITGTPYTCAIRILLFDVIFGCSRQLLELWVQKKRAHIETGHQRHIYRLRERYLCFLFFYWIWFYHF